MKSYDKNKYRQRAAKNTPWLKFVPFRVSRNTRKTANREKPQLGTSRDVASHHY